MPRITVLLPVYNGLPHIRHAVDSVMTQTYRDFTLHLVNDGSTDGTAEYLNSLDDPRIKVTHQKNAGLAITLNRMIAHAEGEFLARMDADDICLPERFARQVEFLDSHPDVAVVGTCQGYVMGDNEIAKIRFFGKTLTPAYSPPMSDPPYWHPADDGRILVHSSVMMRTQILREVGGYPEIVPGQDLALWFRLASHGHKMAHLDEMLLLVRITPSGISSRNLSRQYHTWAHITENGFRVRNHQPEISMEDFTITNPLTSSQLRRLESKARLRNALAHYLAGRRIKGLTELTYVALRDPSLILEKISSRLMPRN
jgi:glycosyltransferase involved in cell wall biosynthesis